MVKVVKRIIRAKLKLDEEWLGYKPHETYFLIQLSHPDGSCLVERLGGDGAWAYKNDEEFKNHWDMSRTYRMNSYWETVRDDDIGL